MPKVLFIAFHFPPCQEIGGSIRSEKFVDYLSDFGWRANVVATGEQNECNVIDGANQLRRLQSLTPYKKPYELTAYGWAFNVWATLRKKTPAYDLIYVSCPPFPQIISSVFLKKKFQVPLILDFRDAWSLDPYQEGSRLKKLVYKYLFPKLEKWSFLYADKVLLNTPSTLLAYQKLYPEYCSKFEYLPNGYDEKDFSELMHMSPFDKGHMSILYCGRFGVGGRKADIILDSLVAIRSHLNVKLVLFGKQPLGLKRLVAEKGLSDIVIVKGQVSHSDVLKEMFQHDVLLMYQEPSASDIQAVAGKTFEYIRVGKPILSIGPEGDNQDLVRHYTRCCEIVTEPKVDNIVSAIENLHAKWMTNSLGYRKHPTEEFKVNFQRKELTKKLCALFDSVLTKAL